MSRKLYPRLNRLVSDRLYADIDWDADEQYLLATSSGPVHEQATFTSTGGERVATEQLAEIREEIQAIAIKHGYPESLNKSEFDRDCAIWLFRNLEICDGESSRDEVWRHFSLVLMPHISKWRFPKVNKDRVYGGVRDTFGRLYERATLFDRGSESRSRWELLDALTEDAFVQILERPMLSGNREIAFALAETWLATSRIVGKARMEEVARLAIKHIRETGSVISFESLDLEDKITAFKEVFLNAAKQLGLDLKHPESVVTLKSGQPVKVTYRTGRKKSPGVVERSRRFFRRMTE